MRTPTSPVKHLFPPRLLERIGVTRVARVTALDRTGIEVACAVRPTGHVLQVSQGKGHSFEAAARSGVYEAVELWAAEHPDPTRFVWASEAELGERGAVWSPSTLNALRDESLWRSTLVLPWVRAARLGARGHAWVPAQLVYCPPPSGADVGLLVSRWTSNGMGAHPQRQAALRHAVLELLERHALSVVLPEGWTPEAVRGRKRAVRSEVVERLRAREFDVAVFDLTPRGSAPVAGALLRGPTGDTIGLTAGYACRPTFAAAVDGAITEAAQSRLTDIHGAREDIAQKGADAAAADVFFAQRPSASASRSVSSNLVTLARGSGLELASVELPSPVPGVHVVKVLARNAGLSELLS